MLVSNRVDELLTNVAEVLTRVTQELAIGARVSMEPSSYELYPRFVLLCMALPSLSGHPI